MDELTIMAWITKKPLTEWILVFAKLYFVPIGRIGRIEFCIAFITVFFWVLIGVYLPGTQMTLQKTATAITGYSFPEGKEYLMEIIQINCIFSIWILISTSIKRLRDLDSKPWFAIFALVPFINLFVLLGLMLSEGTVGMNQYGPQKKPLSL
jgi:uncharacterized membrane protein YhaH (DUF805 family)